MDSETQQFWHLRVWYHWSVDYDNYERLFNAEQLVEWAKFVDKQISLNDKLVDVWKDYYERMVANYAEYCKDTGHDGLPHDLKFPQ